VYIYSVNVLDFLTFNQLPAATCILINISGLRDAPQLILDQREKASQTKPSKPNHDQNVGNVEAIVPTPVSIRG
jgi:hypothetical protein